MRKFVFLLSALALYSTVSASFTDDVDIFQNDEPYEENENLIEEFENIEIAQLFKKANESITKARDEVLSLTKNYKETGIKVKNSTRKYHDDDMKFVIQQTNAWKTIAPGVDLRECDKYIRNYESEVAVAIQKVYDCVDSTQNSVNNFIESINKNVNFINDNLELALQSTKSCAQNKECEAKIQKQASTVLADTVSEMKSKIFKFKITSLYYRAKLSFCPAIDDFKLWLQTPGYCVHKFKLCVRAKKREAKL
ncbi:uncharacterized protein LOC122504017 [Leptopilina heterotoma]|uniref:uncharacterized protein LOC122504017 n=1 Tax=Leptopilina heterotoma TaxID=63436 RepID=UPI001CA91AE5|nr:uncharacterized protein LOC122504017 [Leptopilina heterotoma]